ncbi:hypothetical protein HPB49_011697 [Dermacentor silvarum]|uniref:Uncharacterized protein n=1 Tax=Dermacentor silvarum TaxID=543639 RepID=A0ACB8DJH6_DERSI|nr:hypothetical protein HPB49_011697 [Dermacentor silvarum]
MGCDRTALDGILSLTVSQTNRYVRLNCQHVVSGGHGENLERHLQRRHKEVYDSILADKVSSTKRVVSDEVKGCPAAKLRQVDIQSMFQPTSSKCVFLEITEDSIMNIYVELVTRNGRPFRLIDDSGFRKRIDPVLKALSAKQAITAETVKDKVQEQTKREEISQTLRKRMFSLKIDCVSRLDRALLGINVQYAENGKLILQPLAMKELFDRHTAEHLTSQVKSTLSRYDLSVAQVYSVTTDNDVNTCMLKAASLLGETDHETEASSSDEEADSGYPEF